MTFTEEQKNCIIGYAEKYIAELQRVTSKIAERKDQFVASEGEKTGDMESDLSKITLKELKTKKVVLSKLHSETMNVVSSILSEIKKVDTEIMRQ